MLFIFRLTGRAVLQAILNRGPEVPKILNGNENHLKLRLTAVMAVSLNVVRPGLEPGLF
jgi:hypothetical protein